jgi:hypothetical protein
MTDHHPTIPPPDPQDRAQIAWTAIEADTPVFSADGEEVGKVSKVVGDSDADVFTGLAVSIGTFGADRFVPSERVRGIWPERIELDVPAAGTESLPEYEETPTVRWRPDGGPGAFLRRLFGRR